MTINVSLTAFKRSLKVQPTFKAAKHRLCFLNTVKDHDKPNGYHDDLVINLTAAMAKQAQISLKYYQNIHLVDTFNHLQKTKTPLLDVSLATNKHYQHLLLISNNELLKTCQADYQVVLLDATRDYFDNYYLDLNLKNEPDNFKYTSCCLVFINSDGSYFLALPVSCDTDELQIIQKSQTPIIKTTIKTIELVLDQNQVPLLRTDQISWLKLLCPPTFKLKHSGAKTIYLTGNFWSFYDEPEQLGYLKHVSNQSVLKIATNFMTINNNAFLKANANSYLNESLDDSLSGQEWSYFYQHVKLTLKKGFIHFALDHQNPDYQAIFAEINQPNLIQTSFIPDRYNYYEQQRRINKYLSLRNICDLLISSQKEQLFDLTVKSHKLLAQEIPVKTTKKIKPLIQSTGLNKVMLNLVNDTNKPYYLTKKTLVSLTGKDHINYAKQIKL